MLVVVEREGCDDVAVDVEGVPGGGGVVHADVLTAAVAGGGLDPECEWELREVPGGAWGCDPRTPVDAGVERVEVRMTRRCVARVALFTGHNIDVRADAYTWYTRSTPDAGDAADTAANAAGGGGGPGGATHTLAHDYVPRVWAAGGWREAAGTAGVQQAEAVARLRELLVAALPPVNNGGGDGERVQPAAAHVVRLLVDADVFPHETFRRVLRDAVLEGDCGLCRALATGGVDLHRPCADDPIGYPPLVLAAEDTRREAVALELLAAAAAAPTPETLAPLVNAANAHGKTALVAAATHGLPRLCAALLDAGADTSPATRSGGYTAVLQALKQPLSAPLCLRLIEASTSTTLDARGADGYTALVWAARHGLEVCVVALVQRGVDVNATTQAGDSALLWAASEGHARVCEHLIDAGADVHMHSRNGCAALVWAARAGLSGVCSQLLAAGARVDATTQTGDTALTWACGEGHEAVCDLLVAAGADVNHASGNRMAPLTWAARKEHTAIALLLVAAGADVNSQTATGYTALHYAAEHGARALCAALLAAGARPGLTACSGQTPMDLAGAAGHEKLRAALAAVAARSSAA